MRAKLTAAGSEVSSQEADVTHWYRFKGEAGKDEHLSIKIETKTDLHYVVEGVYEIIITKASSKSGIMTPIKEGTEP